MYGLFKRLHQIGKKYSQEDKRLIAAIQTIVGSKPFNLAPYLLSTKHTSVAVEAYNGFRESNERLEYLGDAVLGMVVAEYLFKKYPFKDEGFLTEIRSRIVNRESLNHLARKTGISKLVAFDVHRRASVSHKSIHGDTLEAFVGAVYLDKGFEVCKKFIIKKLLQPHYDLDEIVRNNPNYKSRIIEWAQKNNHEIEFRIIDIKSMKHFKEFKAELYLDEKPISRGMGLTKKKAEQDAALKAVEELKIDDIVD